IAAAQAMLADYVGHKGPRYLAIVTTMFVFILSGNLMGLIPGLMAPTSNINVTLGCALAVWTYYHWQGIKEQGVGAYLKHFAAPPQAFIFVLLTTIYLGGAVAAEHEQHEHGEMVAGEV